MQQMLRVMFAAVVAVTLVDFSSAATAQSPVQPVVKQIKLTEKQVQGFIAAQKDMSAVLEKIQGATADQLPPQLQAELETAAKKHGFKDFNEYDDVVDNISMVMAGIDPKTKAFTEPAVAIKKEIEALIADKSLPENEKKQMMEELNETLKTVQPIQFPSNIELVKKYYDQIDAALI
jgi:DNA polymerase III delta prime subunit